MSITQSMPVEKKTKGGSNTVSQHVIEIVSDSGEGAQKAGQSFGSLSAKMGNGVWTVEIIPAEIQPPARSRAGASGIRIRVGSERVTNMGDHANLVVALNEQVLYGRIAQDAFTEGTIILLENKWALKNKEEYTKALEDFSTKGFKVIEIPMEAECMKYVSDAKKGKNMWVLGMLCKIYNRDLTKAEDQIREVFKKKSEKVFEANVNLLKGGYNWAKENLELSFEIPPLENAGDQVVMNGNEAMAMGVMAAGIELCAMYPITPATSISHKLAECIENTGGIIHQAEDEIAAIGFAIGSSYAGKTAVTVTSGPGLALKTEFIGLAVMAEVPLVIIDVQRGGPSTGLPTKVEQGDLLATLYGETGDAPKIIIAPATIEECFHYVIKARMLAEKFRTPVIVLTDANLATGVSPYPRPQIMAESFASPIDQSPWNKNVGPFDWDPETGISKRPIPGQKNGMYTLTGLAHDQYSKVAYEPEINQTSTEARSRKIAAVLQTLKPPTVNGDDSGDLLIVGWGSTKGAIEEAVASARKEGMKVSSLHLHFLSPMEPGLEEIFSKFKKVKTVELNYSDKIGDPLITKKSRRYAQLAWLLRAHTLIDVDCYSTVLGQPINPGKVLEIIKKELKFKN